MSEKRRLLAAAGVFIVGVFAYATLAALLGENWQVLMAVLLLPYAAALGTLIHFKFLK